MFRRLETFTAGVQIVAPLLERHGFHFEGESVRRKPSLVGRGEEVAFGEFIRGDRRLLVELFYSLEPVKFPTCRRLNNGRVHFVVVFNLTRFAGDTPSPNGDDVQASATFQPRVSCPPKKRKTSGRCCSQ